MNDTFFCFFIIQVLNVYAWKEIDTLSYGKNSFIEEAQCSNTVFLVT